MTIRIFIIAALAAALLGFWYWTTTPLYAVEQLKVAIKNHDLEKLNKYADVDEVSTHMVDDFLGEAMQNTLTPHPVRRLLVAGLVRLFKPELIKSIRQELLDFVETGNFKKAVADGDSEAESADNPATRYSLSRMDKRLGFKKHAFHGVKYKKVEGKIAVLGLDMYNATYKTDLILEVKMREAEGHWQLIELSNLPQFIAKLAELEIQHPASVDDAPSQDSK